MANDTVTPRTWQSNTFRRTTLLGEQYYMVFGTPGALKLYGFRDPVVEVNLIEDEAGEYRGWLPAGNSDRPKLIAKRAAFEMQFPYGSQSAAASGQGTVIPLRIEEVQA